MLDFVKRIVRSSDANDAKPAILPYVLGLKWVVNTRAELADLAELEGALRASDLPGIEFDKVEPGFKDISYWFYVDNPKRAFKALAALPMIATRMTGLQAAAADRTAATAKFTIVYPR